MLCGAYVAAKILHEQDLRVGTAEDIRSPLEGSEGLADLIGGGADRDALGRRAVARLDHELGERLAVRAEEGLDLCQFCDESLGARGEAGGTAGLRLLVLVAARGRLLDAVATQLERRGQGVGELDAGLGADDYGRRLANLADFRNGVFEITVVLNTSDELDRLAVGDKVAQRLRADVAPHAADGQSAAARLKCECGASAHRINDHKHLTIVREQRLVRLPVWDVGLDERQH